MKFANLESLTSSGALGISEESDKENDSRKDVADGNVKVIKNVAEIDAISGGIETALKATSDIEKLLKAANDTKEQGSMSAKEAKLLKITHESIMKTLNIPMSSIEICTTESFDNPNTSRAASMATLEAMENQSKGIVSKIIAGLNVLFKAVFDFISGIVRSSGALESLIKKCQKKLDSIRTPSMNKQSFESGAMQLSIDGKADFETAMKLLIGAERLVVSSVKLSSVVKDAPDEENARQAIKQAVENLSVLPSDQKVEVSEEEGVLKVKYKAGTHFAESVKALDINQAKQLAAKALEAVKQLRNFEKSISFIKNGIARIIDLLQTGKDAVMSVVGGKEGRDTHRQSYDARLKARQIKVMVDQAGSKFPILAYKSIKAVVDYVRRSIDNLEPKSSGN